MFSTFALTLLLLATTTNFVINSVYSNPVLDSLKDLSKVSSEELSELNNEAEKEMVISNSANSLPLMHRDEDQPRKENGLQSLNYDVEILEESDIRKENLQIEERFRGHGIQLDTDMFVEENIEVHGGETIPQSHMIFTVILAIVGLVSIGLYAALVIWRSHLEQRYGMRALLLSDDDDYCQQHQNRNNSTDGAVIQLQN